MNASFFKTWPIQLIILLVVSCTNEKTVELVPAARNTPEQQATLTMDLFCRTIYIVTQGMRKAIDPSWRLPFHCAGVSIDPYKRVTIDFAEPCKGDDGTMYNGSVSFTLDELASGEYEIDSFQTSNFYINGNQIFADLNFTYLLNGDTTLHAFPFDFSLRTEDSSFIGIEGSPEFASLNDADNDPHNDQCKLNGAITGFSANNVSYSLNTSSPILYNAGCQFPQSGLASFDVLNGAHQSLNFGESPCDNKFSSVVDGVAKFEEIPLF